MNRLIIFGTGAALIGIWLYLSLLPHKRFSTLSNLTQSNLEKPDEGMIKGCFPWSIYYLQSVEYLNGAIACRGNLRCSSDLAYNQIKENVKKTFGDRFIVLLQLEPNLNQLEQEEVKYIFLLAPNFKIQLPYSEKFQKLEWLIWLGSLGLGLLPLGLWFFNSPFNSNFKIFEILPIVIFSLIPRELARRWVANRYGIKISLPFFTPHLGGLVWHKFHILNRWTLFDLAIAPNLVSLVIGLVLVVWGTIVKPTGLGTEFDFKVSLLMTGLHQVLPNSEASILSPMAYAGWCVLNIMAVSLIPVSILDGGYILRSMVGSGKFAMIATPIMRIVVLGLGLVSQQWLIVVAMELFLLNYSPFVPLNDVTELTLGRDILGIFILGLGLMVILPVPEFLVMAFS